MKFVYAIFLFSLLIMGVGCGKSADDQNQEYHRGPLLEALSEQLIQQTHHFHQQMHELASFTEQLTINNQDSLFELIEPALELAYTAWVPLPIWNYAPMQNLGATTIANSFPVDPDKILDLSTNTTHEFGSAAYLGAAGFPALDYLVYHQKNNGLTPDLLRYFSDGVHALNTIAESLISKFNGSFIASFLENDGVAVGSSLGDFVNQYNQELEFTKNFRIAIPSGLRTLGEPLPDHVEFFYGGKGKRTLKKSVDNLHALFLGTDQKPGLKHFLDFLETEKNNEALSAAIDHKFNDIHLLVDALPDQLSEASSDDLVAVFQEFQRLTVLTKSDMPSAMGIQITYVDNDGD